MAQTSAKINHYLELHFVVILFGFTAILGKLVKISALELVFYRTFLAAIGLYFLIKLLKKSISLQKGDLPKLLGIGVVVALHWFLFFYAAKVSNVSVSLVGLATSTLWIALLQPFFNHQKFSFIEAALGLIIVFGLYLIFNADLSLWYGLILSILSAIAQALFSLTNAQFTHKYHSFVITFYEMLGAAAATAAFAIFFKQPFFINGSLPDQYDWFWIMILAFICSVYAYSAIVKLLQYLSAFEVNLVIGLEPIYGILLAYFIFGESEKMNIRFYIGASLICVAILGYQVVKGRR